MRIKNPKTLFSLALVCLAIIIDKNHALCVEPSCKLEEVKSKQDDFEDAENLENLCNCLKGFDFPENDQISFRQKAKIVFERCEKLSKIHAVSADGLERVNNQALISFENHLNQKSLRGNSLSHENCMILYEDLQKGDLHNGNRLGEHANKQTKIGREENHSNFQQNSYRMLQGSAPLNILIIAIFILVPLAIFGIWYLIKRRRQRKSNQRSKADKLKFLPRVALPSEAMFSESVNGLNAVLGKKKTKKAKNNAPVVLSPTHRAQGLKLEENNHHSYVINENIFTNIDNSPKSLEEDSPRSSVRNTPKNINFNIEFSMIEQDSKIKTSARDME